MKKKRAAVLCAQSVTSLKKMQPNKHVADTVERLREVKMIPEERQKRDLHMYHREKLPLFCKEDGRVICWLCELFQEHCDHHTFFMRRLPRHAYVPGKRLERRKYRAGSEISTLHLTLSLQHELCDHFSSYAHLPRAEEHFCAFYQVTKGEFYTFSTSGFCPISLLCISVNSSYFRNQSFPLSSILMLRKPMAWLWCDSSLIVETPGSSEEAKEETEKSWEVKAYISEDRTSWKVELSKGVRQKSGHNLGCWSQGASFLFISDSVQMSFNWPYSYPFSDRDGGCIINMSQMNIHIWRPVFS